MKKDVKENNVPKSKAKGCLKIIGIVVVIVFVLGMIGNMLPEKEKTPLENFFTEHNLGEIENVEEIDRGEITQMNFVANRIDYGAYVYNKGEKEGEIVSIWTKFMPFYSTDDNDMALDDSEKAILHNRANFLEEINGQLKMTTDTIKEDLKNSMNYPKTFSLEKVTTFDNGTFFLQNIVFTAKNAFGVESENTAIYKIDFETNTFELQGIY